MDFIGLNGGGGIGAGPGIIVGAALALKGSGRIPVKLYIKRDCSNKISVLIHELPLSSPSFCSQNQVTKTLW